MLMYPFFLLQFVSTLYSIYETKLSLLFKTESVMSLPAIQTVLFLFYNNLSVFMAHDVIFSLSTMMLPTII